MCTPKPPKIEKTPTRQIAKLPDGGDAGIAAGIKARSSLGPSALIFANKGGTLGAPSVTNALGV